jgi:hypothetical protein
MLPPATLQLLLLASSSGQQLQLQRPAGSSACAAAR